MSTQPPTGIPKPTETPQAINQNTTSSDNDSRTDMLPEELVSDVINLPEGKALNDIAALELAKSRPIQWIVLAGPTDSGKTTVLTSLFELFQWNKVKGYRFAGSETLPAFEERCYLSRRDSGNEVAHTRRTHYEWNDPEYLHLRIRSTTGLRPFTDFLFADVSGEMFEHARDSVPQCKELLFLKRAHHFLLFLDSARAVQQNNRWAVAEDGKALLQSCIDSEMVWENCVVNVVWSRFDYFKAKEAEHHHQVFRKEVEEEFRKTFSQFGSRLKFSETAARPLEAPDLHTGHGVQALLDQWATAPLEMKASELFPTSFAGTRESELFATRHFSTTANDESKK